jgi:hypothetical protein
MTTCRKSHRTSEQGIRSVGSERCPTLRLALSLLIPLVLLGCAHTPPSPPPLSGELKTQLGTIGIVATGAPLEVDYRTPGRGGAAGAAIGAAKGLGLGTLGGAGCFLSLGQFAPACVVAAATPYFTVRYAVDQANEGVSGEAIKTGEAAITAAFADRNLQEVLREQVLRVAPVRTGQSFVLPSDLGPSSTSEGGSYQPLASQGIDTVLEIGVQRVALQASRSSTSQTGSLWSLSAAGLNPSLRIVVTARTRVVKVADGAELYARTGEHQGNELTFTEWAANDAQAFREGLDQLMPNLAAEIVAQVFGVAAPAETNPAASTESDQSKEP